VRCDYSILLGLTAASKRTKYGIKEAIKTIDAIISSSDWRTWRICNKVRPGITFPYTRYHFLQYQLEYECVLRDVCSVNHSSESCPNPENPSGNVEDLYFRVKNVDAGRSSVIELIHANTANNRMLYATILKVLPLSTVKLLRQLVFIVLLSRQLR
jgi:hypothetical protein